MITSKLSKVTNALITVAMVVLVVLVIEQRWTQYQDTRQRVELEQARTYQPREVVADTPELKLHEAARTLLVGTSSACRYCTASMPFYATLFEVAKTRGVKVVAYTMEDVEMNRAYLVDHAVAPDTVVSASTNGILLPATPMLTLVQRDGAVIQSWMGQLTPSQEEEVMKVVQEGI